MFSAGPMPDPVSRYHGALLVEVDAGVLPVAQLGRVRAALVAARDERRLRGLDLAQASRMSLPGEPAGSAFGPTSTKSLYMTCRRLTPKPSATNFSSAALSCTNTTSASPRRASIERLARAQRDDAHLDAAGLLEQRQQMPKEAGLLGRGGRGDGDEALLRMCRRDQRYEDAADERKQGATSD